MRAWPVRSLSEGALRRSALGGIALRRRSSYLLQTASSSFICKQGIRRSSTASDTVDSYGKVPTLHFFLAT
jgi:hypothetical protein